MTSKFSLITALLLLTSVTMIQVANAASIEVPKYEVDELMPEEGLGAKATQVIEYPDGQTKIEVPYKDEDQKAWINVEAYQICLEDDRDLSREAGLLPEQQPNTTAAKEAEETLKSMMPIIMEVCIEMNAQYAETCDIAN